MKVLVILLLAIAPLILSAPSQITDNNVGNIVNVGIRGNLTAYNRVDLTLINFLAAMYNRQLTVVAAPAGPEMEQNSEISAIPSEITPEMIEQFKEYMKDIKH